LAINLAQATSLKRPRRRSTAKRISRIAYLGGDQLPLLEPHGGFLGVLWRSEP